MSNVKDMRFERTERHLMEAVFTLGRKKDVSSLTVREVSEYAEINRITFYNHYETIEDLLTNIEEMLMDRFEEEVGPFTDFIEHSKEYIKG